MGKIKDFFSKWLDEEFWGAVLTIIVVAAVSVGLQYFLFWFGNSAQSIEHLGYYLDTGLLVWLAIITSPCLDSSVMFPYEGTRVLGTMCVSAVCFGLLGVYVYFVYANSLALVLISMMLLFWGWIALETLNADTNPLLIYTSVGLIYALGAHYAMQFNGMAIAVEDAIIIILLILTLIFWFKPAFD